MLEVQNLHARYGRIPILNGVDLTVAEGEAVGVLGHNGMGKTTLIRTLMGYLAATDGSIWFRDLDITRLPTHARVRNGLGYVPQGRGIFPNLTTRDNLEMGAVGPGTDGNAAAEIDRVLDDFPVLKDLLDRPGGALSGGQQQILSIARCLCGNPRLLLLDEPTEGVQPSIIEEIAENLGRLRASRDLTIIVVEQNIDFIAALASRVLMIQKGRIVRELAASKLHDATILDEFIGVRSAGPSA